MPTNPTIAAYDQYFDVYDQEVVEFWDKFPQATIKAFCEALRGQQVLDLGSGSGRDAIILRDQGLEVTCLDASGKMVEMTRRLGFESRQAEFSNMQLADNYYDGVWAYTSLIHVSSEDAQAAMRVVARALKPNGIFLVGVIVGDTAGMVERKTMPNSRRYFKYYRREEITEMVSSCGFRLLYQEEYQPHTTTYLSQVYQLAL